MKNISPESKPLMVHIGTAAATLTVVPWQAHTAVSGAEMFSNLSGCFVGWILILVLGKCNFLFYQLLERPLVGLRDNFWYIY